MKKHFTNIASQVFGRFANCKFPNFLQKIINIAYVKALKLDMSEFENVDTFKSLNELFTRSLKKKRVLSKAFLISPSDSFISECGLINNGTILQIKGHLYHVNELIFKDLKSGSFINFYLSPRDYHRYHAPCDLEILSSLYIPGKLYPVNFTYLKKIPSLFCENERVILACKSKEFGFFYMVFVGALNVGQMIFHFDEKIQTNANLFKKQSNTYNNLFFKKGDELGFFKMGSTIVLLFEKELNFTKKGIKIKFGDAII